MTAPSHRPGSELLPGARVEIPLTPARGDVAEVRLLAVPRRDLAWSGRLSSPLHPFADALLVDVRIAARVLLPGAWVQREVFERGTPLPPRPVRAHELRLPAVIAGSGPDLALHWGETIWPLDLGGAVAVPQAGRADPHPLSRLRRLLLVASGRREEIALTLWQDPDFEIPWQDVRLLERAAEWFEIAQVPSGMRYADAERAQGVGRYRR